MGPILCSRTYSSPQAGISPAALGLSAIIWRQIGSRIDTLPRPMHSQTKSRILATASAVLLIGSATAIEGSLPGEWTSSLDRAIERSEAEDRLILVDLYADWCGWCKRLEEEVYSTQEFREFARDLILLRVDTEDRGEGAELKARYGVYSLPTTLILNHRLVEVGKVEGFAPAVSYIRKIEHRIASFRQLEEGYARFSGSTDPRALSTLAVEFHQRLDGPRAAELYRRMLALDSLPAENQTLTRYRLSDALRIALDFDAAERELEIARAAAQSSRDPLLLDRIELLAGDIALDRGDCERAREAFESLLGRGSSDEFKRQARRGLATIQAQEEQCS